jgi:CheY-like chemotaxis protein
VVEDNALNLELVFDLLESKGFDVISACNAEECFAVLAERRPDVVLMDIQLPGKDGLTITRELRSNPITSELPIVAMTAYAMIQDQERVFEAGCDGYLAKPLDTRRLADQLQTFIATKRGIGEHSLAD